MLDISSKLTGLRHICNRMLNGPRLWCLLIFDAL